MASESCGASNPREPGPQVRYHDVDEVASGAEADGSHVLSCSMDDVNEVASAAEAVGRIYKTKTESMPSFKDEMAVMRAANVKQTSEFVSISAEGLSHFCVAVS